MDADVIVVGGGPSGLTVAYELALGGAKVMVIERRTQPVESRAGTILPRVLELLDTRGLAETFVARARRIRANPLFTAHIWAGMQPVEWKHLGSRWGYRLILPQNNTEELLLQHAQGLGVEVRAGLVLETLQQDADGVTMEASSEAGRHTLRAPWMIGADGGGSTVRKLLGIPFEGRDATFTGIVADVTFDFPWADGRRMTDNARGWATAFPFGEDEPLTRFNMVHTDRRHAHRSEPVTEEEVRQCLREIYEDEVPFGELRWGSRFGDALRIAERFREGRVMLLGEACRIHYPASGVGMNFCMQDAFNLGWKLAAVIKGHASADLLDTYESERRPVTEALLASVQAQCAVQFDFTPEGRAFKQMFRNVLMPMPEVNRRLAHELNGLTVPYAAAPGGHPFEGERMPDIDLVIPGGVTRISRLLRGQRFILADLTGNGGYDDLDFADLPIEIVNAVPSNPPPMLEGVRSLLVRPDAYIGWADTALPCPEAAVQQIRRWFDF